MKAITVTIGGKKQHLLYSVDAMYKIKEKHGDINGLLEQLEPDTLESFDAACEVIGILAESGELARRYMGHDAGEVISGDALRHIVQPSELVDFKLIIPRVVSLGFGREIDAGSDDEVDLGLLELNQKKTT